MNIHKLPVLILLITTILSSCHQQDIKYESSKNTLFRLLQPEESGIKFGNMLIETDTFNSIFY